MDISPFRSYSFMKIERKKTSLKKSLVKNSDDVVQEKGVSYYATHIS